MAIFNLEVFDISWITTSAATFDDNGGYQFAMNSDTVTITPGAETQVIRVDDPTNNTFDDDDPGPQTTDGSYTLNGVTYPDGTIIESEYELIVRDGDNNTYTLQFISMSNDAWNIEGFVVQGPVPPFGEALTVIGRTDGVSGSYAYATSSPACFGLGTRIATETGDTPVEALEPGAMLRLADGALAPVRFVLSQTVPAATRPEEAPVRLRAGSLGPGLPRRDLVLSPHHRVFLPCLKALVPARALTQLRRIGKMRDAGPTTYVHLVTDRHSLVLAEGVTCESFWPGPMAFGTLPPDAVGRIRAAMGPAPEPAAPFLRMSEARRILASAAQAA
ncbi:hypothetical protein ATO6_07255 [Oceanicola sp. 22II-s10i]|uniref:Hint domain-containing protein n=1 Tax=Oceanicola sp. 22II-s10i TaxID=1317116 RepID=UPI000B51F8FD|nr:Hint domain-containing protein [Oceanicola sp. 22II-s10i]OWU86574.1 hypothetical protein ATO6_07255 [Oceanicola sp. 22II-s10i]